MNGENLMASPKRLGIEIRELTRQAKAMTVYYAVEIGRRLTAAKSMVPHGGWADWVKENTEFSQTTATRMMRIFDEYGAAQIGIFGAEANSATLQNLSISNALRLLAVPEDEREEFAEAVDAENLSARELEKAIKERDAAVRERESAMRQSDRDSLRAEQAEKEAAEANERMRGMEDELTAAKQDACQLAEQVQELKNRPIEVAVQRDEAAIREAEEKARAEGEKKLQEKTDEWEKLAAKAKTQQDALEKQLKDALAAAEKAKRQGDGLDDLQAEIDSLRKKLAMSGQEIVTAKLRFSAWQESFNALTGAVANIPEDDKKAPLIAAIRAQLGAWEKKLGVEA